MILAKMPEIYAYSILQPICKLNSVLMEMSKEENSDIKVSITGPEINVKRAKLQFFIDFTALSKYVERSKFEWSHFS